MSSSSRLPAGGDTVARRRCVSKTVRFIKIFSPSLFLEYQRKAAEVIIHETLDALPCFPGQRGICDDEQTHKLCMMSVCIRVRASEQDGALGRVGAWVGFMSGGF